MKDLLDVYSGAPQRWVGDGFPVRTLLSHATHGAHITPFLMLDYAGPTDFAPGNQPRGVPEHPHRGFETVTLVYQGEVAHRDSTGAGGRIGPGDVQWMTAGAGILHEEFHSEAFTQQGGTLEMIQLWVNLPAAAKDVSPGYQPLRDEAIPAVELPHGGGTVRVIAGEFQGHTGPAWTHTPMQVWDMRLQQGGDVRFDLPDGWPAAVVVLHGNLTLNGYEPAREAQAALFRRDGTTLTLEAETDATLLVLSGEPIDEPVAAQGPFVMNTTEEIRQAFADYKAGRLGRISSQ